MDRSAGTSGRSGSRMQECLSPKHVLIEGEFGKKEATFFPTICDSLPEEFKEKARKELNETEESRAVGLKELRDFIKREDLSYVIDDNFLLMFLRCKKFDIGKAKDKLKSFHVIQSLLIDYVEIIDMEKVHTMLDTHMLGFLPYRDSNGCAVFYTLAYATYSESISLEELATCATALVLFVNSFPMTSVCGLSYISDWSFRYLRDAYVAAMVIRKRLSHVNAFPYRIHRVDVINEMPLIHYLFKTIYHFLSSKIRERIYFHGTNMECLKFFYPPSILPTEFGGSLGPLDNSSYKKPFIEYLLKLKSMQKRLKRKDSGLS